MDKIRSRRAPENPEQEERGVGYGHVLRELGLLRGCRGGSGQRTISCGWNGVR